MIQKKTLTPIILAGIFFIMLGLSFDICVVPPKPVALQNMSYKGTAANERPNIIKKIPAKIIGVSVFF